MIVLASVSIGLKAYLMLIFPWAPRSNMTRCQPGPRGSPPGSCRSWQAQPRRFSIALGRAGDGYMPSVGREGHAALPGRLAVGGPASRDAPAACVRGNIPTNVRMRKALPLRHFWINRSLRNSHLRWNPIWRVVASLLSLRRSGFSPGNRGATIEAQNPRRKTAVSPP